MSDPVESSRKCCFCMNLKSGSYLSGAYGLLVSLLGIAGSILMVTVYLPMAREKAADLLFAEHPEYAEQGFTRQDVIDLVNVSAWAYWIALGLYSIWLLASLLLIIGVSTKRRALMICFVIITIIVSGLCGISLINSLINARATFADSTGVVTVVMIVLIVLLNFYAIWCVVTHMKDLKAAQCSGTVVSQAAPLNPPPMYSPPGYAEYNKCPDTYYKQ